MGFIPGIIILAVCSVALGYWLVLLLSAKKEDLMALAYCKVLKNHYEIRRLRQKDHAKAQKLSQYQGVLLAFAKLLWGGTSQKEIQKLERENARLQAGNFRGLNPFILPGYAIQRQFTGIGKGALHKTLYDKSAELYGRMHAEKQAQYYLAGILSYPVLGLGLIFSLSTLIIASGLLSLVQGLAIMGIGAVLVLVLVYAMYDDLNDKLNKRHARIERQFPNIVSKLALLVSSGMIVPEAWRQTAFSGEGDLYLEMRRTADDLERQNMGYEAAYGGFISRSNTKEATKLATVIMQSQAKGNAEIGLVLRELARESWQERKHSARRNAEKANSKLMIPTMLLFVAILVMIMVPIMSSFGAL